MKSHLPSQRLNSRVIWISFLCIIIAVLASTVFVFEVTRDSNAIIPLLGSCALAFMISHLGMENSIMTEKIVRRGVEVPTEWGALKKESERNEI